jgi:hypothetical protein
MKRWMITTACLLMGALSAHADSSSYEAQFGLITVGGFIVFYNSQGPLSYNTLTLKDLPADAILLGEVRGTSCQHGVSIPIFMDFTHRATVSGAQGNGSYKKAVEDIQQDHPQLDGIFDVKIDIHNFSILGIYKRECTEISALGFRIPTSTDSPKIESR